MADWSVDERKLNSAYEDIQQGRLKPAQSDVDRWLKKHPKSQPALVLRMMIVGRQGLGSAAVLKAYDEVRKTGPLSGRSIWRISSVLRGIRRQDMVLSMFREIWDAHPEVAELADQVFFEAAALGDTATMAAATRKTFNLNKVPERARLAAYSAWANVVPEPSDADLFPVAPARALLPAHLLLRTTGDAAPTADILWLRLQVAIGNKDEAEARRLIREHGRNGSLARRWVAMEAAKILAERSEDAKAIWEEELTHVVAVLRNDPEAQHNYAYYKHALAAGRGARKSDEVLQVFAGLVTSIGDKERAPLLAVLEHAVQDSIPEEDWAKLINDYLARWGSKWTTVNDLVGIAGHRADKLSEIVRGSVKPHQDERTFCASSVAELYLRRGKSEGSLEQAKRLWTMYTEGLVYGKNLPKTDSQPADPIGLAAVEETLRVWQQTPQPETLFTAAAMLEYMLKHSPSSFPARLTLVRIYRLLGAGPAVAPHMQKLNLTEIQFDNLAHIFTERGALEAELGGYKKTWDDLVSKAQFMYSRCASDLPEYIKQMLQHESYSKVHGLRALVSKLERSVSQRILEVEQLSRSLTAPSETAIETLTAALAVEEWSDNRDYELIVALKEPSIDEQTIRALGVAALRVAAFLKGDTVAQPARIPSEVVDAAYVAGVDIILQGAVDGKVGEVFDASIAAYEQASASQKQSAILSLIQLSQVVDAVAGKVATGVKKKRTPAQLAFSEGFKVAKSKLASIKWEDQSSSPSWADSRAAALSVINDEDFVDEIVARVKDAQQQMTKGLSKALK